VQRPAHVPAGALAIGPARFAQRAFVQDRNDRVVCGAVFLEPVEIELRQFDRRDRLGGE